MTAYLVEDKTPRGTSNTPDARTVRIGGWFVPLTLLVTLLVLLLGLAPSAFAHKPSDSYLSLTPRAGGWDARWDIALREQSTYGDIDVERLVARRFIPAEGGPEGIFSAVGHGIVRALVALLGSQVSV